MVRIFFILIFPFALNTVAQTTVYATTAEGLPDKNNYYYFENSKIFICDHCKQPFKDTSSFNNSIVVNFSEDRFVVEYGQVENVQQAKLVIGYLSEEKKILPGKFEVKDGVGNAVYATTPEQESKAPYIYDKKVYNSNGTIIAFIKGDEKYGAAWYFLTTVK